MMAQPRNPAAPVELAQMFAPATGKRRKFASPCAIPTGQPLRQFPQFECAGRQRRDCAGTSRGAQRPPLGGGDGIRTRPQGRGQRACDYFTYRMAVIVGGPAQQVHHYGVEDWLAIDHGKRTLEFLRREFRSVAYFDDHPDGPTLAERHPDPLAGCEYARGRGCPIVEQATQWRVDRDPEDHAVARCVLVHNACA